MFKLVFFYNCSYDGEKNIIRRAVVRFNYSRINWVFKLLFLASMKQKIDGVVVVVVVH